MAALLFVRSANRVDVCLFASYAEIMKSAAFNKLIAKAYTKPEKTVILYARLLKEAGMLTTGARGRNAPEMTPLDAARMTLAILTTDSPSQCVERVKRFGQIPFSPDFRKLLPGYRTMSPEQFSSLFEGETLEEVLAFIFSLPRSLGIEESCAWYDANNFHLRVSDFQVLAELFQYQYEGSEIVGELVAPFKGQLMIKGPEGWRHVEGYSPIPGGVVTVRTISGASFMNISLGLLDEGHGDTEAV